MKVDYEIVLKTLKNNNITIECDCEMKNGNGRVLKTTNGAIVNCYNTGSVTFQGKNSKDIQQLFGDDKKILDRKVFVVYGHDTSAKTQLEAMLRRWDMEPIILDQMVSSGQTIIEKLEEYTEKVNFAIVLATPDDIGYAKDNESNKKYRVRQNVILEMGMLLAKLGREKVAILLSQLEDMESPSDIDGLIYIPFKDNVEETKISLVKELEKNGFKVEVSKL